MGTDLTILVTQCIRKYSYSGLRLGSHLRQSSRCITSLTNFGRHQLRDQVVHIEGSLFLNSSMPHSGCHSNTKHQSSHSQPFRW